ncbi:MAG: hypothetical protein QM719_01785 [Thermomonas sp.]
MLLRRFARSLKDQNWTAILIEFALLVLGVFLGMQVSNWNQDLAGQRLGRAYAARLGNDLGQDLASRRQLVAYYAAVLDSVERTDALLADPRSDPKAVVASAYRASEINLIPSVRATWDEIVSSGDTGLLPRGVARPLATYYAFDTARDIYSILLQSPYRHRVRNLIPLAMQKALRAGCSDVRDEAQQITGFMRDCNLDFDPKQVAATVATLRADPVVRENLRYQYSDVYSAHANIQGDVAAIERALAALKGQAGAAGAPP